MSYALPGSHCIKEHYRRL